MGLHLTHLAACLLLYLGETGLRDAFTTFETLVYKRSRLYSQGALLQAMCHLQYVNVKPAISCIGSMF